MKYKTKSKIHAIAGIVGLITILTFCTSTVYSELFTTPETIATVKAMIWKGMFILVPAMVMVGGSGMSLGAKRMVFLPTGSPRGKTTQFRRQREDAKRRKRQIRCPHHH